MEHGPVYHLRVVLEGLMRRTMTPKSLHPLCNGILPLAKARRCIQIGGYFKLWSFQAWIIVL